MKLLTRTEFREQCLARDKHRCLICGQIDNLSVHHIIERRLFPDGGYYQDNGATLCDPHHLEAEQTVLSCDYLRNLIGIKQPVLPPHLELGDYDKWGNPVLPNGQRLIGELFEEEPVQKMLREGNVLHLFTSRVKYPRTYHLPWSPGRTSDDKVLHDTSCFEGKEVVVTVKMDGECTSLYADYLHARSLEFSSHPSRNLMKQIHSTIKNDIPDRWRICGENVTAEHSIHYNDLPSYFLIYSIWNEKNWCLSWDETQEWANLLDLFVVDEIYRGVWDEAQIKNLYQEKHKGNECEGYVVRVTGSFAYKDFRKNVAKFVRKNHIKTNDVHWATKPITLNDVRK